MSDSEALLAQLRQWRVPAIEDVSTRPYGAADFASFVSGWSSARFSAVCDQLLSCSDVSAEVMAEALLVVGEQTVELGAAHWPWQSQLARDGVRQLAAALLAVAGCASLQQLCRQSGGTGADAVSAAIAALCGVARRDSWRAVPAATLCAPWLAVLGGGAGGGETLTRHLPHLLPPLLLLLDDCESRHQVAALMAVEHLWQHVPGAVLREGGRGAVLGDAVQRLVTAPLHRDSWRLALPLSLRLLVLCHGAHSRPVTEHVRQFLATAGCAGGAGGGQLASVQHVPLLVAQLGAASVCWLRPLLELLLQYVEAVSCPDSSCWQLQLAVVASLVALATSCGGRLARHADMLHALLLRLAYDALQSAPPAEQLVTALRELVACLPRPLLHQLVGEWRLLLKQADDLLLPGRFCEWLGEVVRQYEAHQPTHFTD